MIGDHVYKFFADYIRRFTGIVYEEKDFYRLTPRLDKLKEKVGSDSFDDLVRIFSNEPPIDLHTFLISTSTNNETRFFRDKSPFDLFINNIIPTFVSENRRALQIWSAGCSTGQEPYSLSMQVKEKFGENLDFSYHIEATDICNESLSKAKKGHYDWLEIQRGLPIFLLAKYFDQVDDKNWEVKQFLKTNISFKEFNLLSSNYPINKFDVIFCRNVLIYQTAESKKEIIKKFFQALKPGGYYIMGAGESLIGMDDIGFENVIEDGVMFYRKPSE